MTNTDQSFIVQQLLNTLALIEQESANTLAELDALRDSDPEMGYAKATGYAKGKLQGIIITANVYRTSYTNA